MHKDFKGKNCDRALQVFKNVDRIATAILWGTAGANTQCIDKLLQFPAKSFTIEIHATNEARRRGMLLQKQGEFLPLMPIGKLNAAFLKEDPAVVKAFEDRIFEILTFAMVRYDPKIRWILSLGLESNDTWKAARKRANIAAGVWPFEIAWNPVFNTGGFKHVGADFIELHGANPKIPKSGNVLLNLDGTEADFTRGKRRSDDIPATLPFSAAKHWIAKYRDRAAVLLFWQGRASNCASKGGFVAPRDRRCIVDRKASRNVNRLLKRYNNY